MRNSVRHPHPLALAIVVAISALAAAPAAAQRLIVEDGSEQVADGDYAGTATGQDGHALRARNPGSRITGSGIVAASAASSTLVAEAQGSIELTGAILRSPFNSGYVAWADTGGVITLDNARFELTPSTSSATNPSTALGAAGGGTIRMRGGAILSTASRIAHASGVDSVVDMAGVTIEAGADPHVAGAFRAADGGRVSLQNLTYRQTSGAAMILHAAGAGSHIQVGDSRFDVGSIRTRDRGRRNAGGAVHASDGGSIRLGSGTVVASSGAAVGLAGTAQSVSVFAVGSGSAITLDGAAVDALGESVIGVGVVDGGRVAIGNGARLRTNGTSMESAGLFAEDTGSRIEVGAATIEAGWRGAEATRGGSILLGSGTQLSAVAPGARGLVASSGGSIETRDARIRAYGHTEGNPAYGVLVRGGQDTTLTPSKVVLGQGTVVEADGVGLVLDAAQALSGSVTWVSVPAHLQAEGVRVTGGIAGAASFRGSSLSSVNSSIEGGTLYALRVYDDEARADINGGRLALTNATGDNAAAIQVRHGTVRLQDRVDVTSSNGVLILDPGDGFGRGQTRVDLHNTGLTGNVVTRHATRSAINLHAGSTLAGRAIGSGLDPDHIVFGLQKADAHGWNVAIDASSGWDLAGDSDIRSLRLAGTLAFASPTNDAFKTLLVYGDYVGEGGMLTFNTRLGGDDSATDRFIVAGDTSGTTRVTVHNAGGTGAPTVEGIRLIRVDGRSDGTFNLHGRAVAGNYDYFLHQGSVSAPANGHWYLRSQAQSPPAPDPGPTPVPVPVPVPEPDPTPAPNPTPIAPSPPLLLDPDSEKGPTSPTAPVYRPEPGIYLANLAAVDLFSHSLHERRGEWSDGTAGSAGAWARVTQGRRTADTAADQVESHTHSALVQIGADVASGAFGGGAFDIGAMLGVGHADTRSRSNLSGYRAKGQLQGHLAGIYTTWRAPQTRAYVDGWMHYGKFRNHVQGEHLAAERYDSTAWSVSLEAGRSFEIARRPQTTWYLQPQLQLTYSHHDADDHVEANGTLVEFVEASSLTSRLGARIYAAPSAAGGHHVQPYAGVHWRHVNGDHVVALDGERLQQRQPDNLYEVNLGLTFELGGGWAGWSQFAWQRGDGSHRDVGGLVGARYQW